MATLILRPNADSVAANWTGVGDTTNLYANVDESSKNESDYNRFTIMAIYSYLAVKIGSTVYYSSDFGEPGSVTLRTWERTTKPSDSSAWTWTDIDNILSGVCSTNSGTTYPILYSYPNHTTESGTINKVTFKSYLGGYYDKYTFLCDIMTWIEVDYTESTTNFIYDKMRCLYVPTFGGIR